MNTNYTSIILSISLFFTLAVSMSAAPGDLDPTFSDDGKFTDGPGSATGVVIQPDGKLVVAGNDQNNFLLVRYLPDGSLDNTFGANGRVSTSFGTDFAGAAGIAIQSDGKLVVAGYGCPCDDFGAAFFAIVRYNPNGSLDLSFDGDGKVTTEINYRATGWSVTIQPDNKIIVAGWSWAAAPPYVKDHFALARYNPDGSLDGTFGEGGKVTTSICGNCNDEAFSVAVQPDGKIVAVGGSFDGTANTQFSVVRYNANGTLDTTFDSDGRLTTSFGVGQYAEAVTIQEDGKIVAGGASWNNNTRFFALSRYNANGSLDTTFDSDGKVTTPGLNGASSVVIQSDGKIVAAGSSSNGTNNDFAILRYKANGSPDTTFGGGDGKSTVDFDNTNDYAYDMSLDNLGRAVVVGGSGGTLAVARFLGDSAAAPRSAQFDFDGDRRADVSVFRPSNRVWYLNQSNNGFSATQFGLSTDIITPADFDGDGKTDISVFREGVWYWLNSSNGNFNTMQFGLSGDVPLPADFTGDGRAELVIYRGGVWFTLDLTNNQFSAVQFGLPTDKPVVGDYDGDSLADYAVYRDGTWYLLQSTQGFAAAQFGLSTDWLVPADYDGDGKTDQAVYRGGVWYVLQSSQGFTAFQFGLASDTPAPADYDGDGKTDGAVFRDGVWYLRQSANGFAATQFGLANDKPVPAAYLP